MGYRRISLLAAGLALVVAGLGACATAGGGGIMSRTRLDAEDLSQARQQTLYEFLQSHGKVSFITRGGRERVYVFSASTREPPARVVVDGRELDNPVSELENVPLSSVSEIRILRDSEARMRYGRGNYMGALVIETKG